MPLFWCKIHLLFDGTVTLMPLNSNYRKCSLNDLAIGYKQQYQCTVCKYDVREKKLREVEQDGNEDKQVTSHKRKG